jgi:GDP/UDP-N,N'-diacetylbacillosamine 2-epimerase (hydrolysing)
MTRTICVVTGTRAEYGLLRWVMEGVRDRDGLALQLVVTGAHLAPEFGSTFHEIERDGFRIDAKVELLLSSDSGTGIAKAMGLGLIGFADVLRDLQPDIMLVLGDRFEILAAVAAALSLQIPVAHIHGGEVTSGAIDDAMRHAITKMSHLHFVAAEPYRRRVVQLGETPARVHLVGGLGVDNVSRLPLLDRAALEVSLGVSLAARNLLVTFHPVTAGEQSSDAQMSALLEALAPLAETRLLFTMPNADAGGRALAAQVRHFVDTHDNACLFTSLGQVRYLSCLRVVDGVVGNSSSGLLEAPSLSTPAINIGDRQQGRLKAASVIDCAATREAISAAIDVLYSPAFRATLPGVLNPYGDGGASERVVDVLASADLTGITRKMFHDL